MSTPLIDRIVADPEHFNAKDPCLTEAEASQLRDEFGALLPVARVRAWSLMTSRSIEYMPLTKAAHKACADLVLELFGTKAGEPGVLPNYKRPRQYHETPELILAQEGLITLDEALALEEKRVALGLVKAQKEAEKSVPNIIVFSDGALFE